jgi:2',3'-cyclic-nucleotide 2'-phosphodiesterase (5'-nucleotidase family)
VHRFLTWLRWSRLALLLAGCAAGTFAFDTTASNPAAAEALPHRHLLLAITSQVRGSLASEVLDPEHLPGGWLHLAVLARRARQANPDLILIDTGNALTGAPDALPSPVQARVDPPSVRVLKALGYDALVPGDQDIGDWARQGALPAELDALSWQAANLRIAGMPPSTRSPASAEGTVIERGGLRVGIVGVVSATGLLGLDPEARSRLKVSDAVQAVRSEAKRLRQKEVADIVVVIGGGSASEDASREAGLLEGLPLPNAAGRIADQATEVDLVIAGRGRFPLKGESPRPNRSYRVPLVEPVPSSHALSLVSLDLVQSGAQWRVAGIAEETQWTNEQTDPALAKEMAAGLAATKANLGASLPVYVSGRAIKRAFFGCAAALGHAAVLRVGHGPALGPGSPDPVAQGPELSLLPSQWNWPKLTAADKGRNLTRGDVHRWIPQDDRLVRAELYGRQITLLLEPYVRQQHGWRIPPSTVLAPGGLDLTLVPQRSEAVRVRIAGTDDALRPDTVYTVWMSTYHRFGGSGLAARALLEPTQPYRLEPTTLREAVLALLADGNAPLPSECDSFLSRQRPAATVHHTKRRRS